MDFVFWIILLVVIAGVAWWWFNRRKSSSTSGGGGHAEGSRPDGGVRADGALAGGGAAATAEAAATTGIAGSAGFGAPAEPAAPTTADEPAETKAPAASTPAAPQGHSRAGATAVGTGAGTDRAEATARDEGRVQDDSEWETQWSEASGSPHAHEGASLRESSAAASPAGAQPNGAPSAVAADGTGASRPVHHPEYTEPHAPTLPGAETAAVEDVDDAGTAVSAPVPFGSTSGSEDSGESGAATGLRLPSDAGATETQERAQSSALVETEANHSQDTRGGSSPGAQEPAGHLAAEEPYGAGSASAGADGSGPADYTVKGDAGAMVYYEEGHPEHEQVRADVWFESAAHAEAAGFRAPRRKRI
ncbi:sunset domain-containing protein [Arthrobacter sp. D3-16]